MHNGAGKGHRAGLEHQPPVVVLVQAHCHPEPRDATCCHQRQLLEESVTVTIGCSYLDHNPDKQFHFLVLILKKISIDKICNSSERVSCLLTRKHNIIIFINRYILIMLNMIKVGILGTWC